MLRHGIEWEEGYESWTGVTGRYHICIWLFGPRYQCKVLVEYEHGEPSNKTDSPTVGMCLPISETLEAAMEMGLTWIREYEDKGPDTPEKVFKASYNNWVDLYQYRHQVLSQLFLTCGGGYSWLDGCIVDTSPFSHLEVVNSPVREDSAEIAEMAATWAELIAANPELDDDGAIAKYLSPPKVKTPGPHPDDGRMLETRYTSGFCNISRVPDDVTDEWLRVAYETALMLRDRSDTSLEGARGLTQLENRTAGYELAKSIMARFGPRLKDL
jgi:hypothetical protein